MNILFWIPIMPTLYIHVIKDVRILRIRGYISNQKGSTIKKNMGTMV